MRVDTALYEQIAVSAKQALSVGSNILALSDQTKLRRLIAFCEDVQARFIQTEEALKKQAQRVGGCDSVQVNKGQVDADGYFISPGSNSLKLDGLVKAGIGGTLHASLVEATWSQAFGILQADAAVQVGDVQVKGEAHAALWNKDRMFDPTLLLYAKASASLLQGSVGLSTGNDIVSAGVSATGRVGSVQAEAKAVISKEEATLEAKVGAAALSGEVQCAFQIFGVKITLTGSGSLGNAEAELSFSHKNREWEFGSKLGFIAGLGFKVNVTY